MYVCIVFIIIPDNNSDIVNPNSWKAVELTATEILISLFVLKFYDSIKIGYLEKLAISVDWRRLIN